MSPVKKTFHVPGDLACCSVARVTPVGVSAKGAKSPRKPNTRAAAAAAAPTTKRALPISTSSLLRARRPRVCRTERTRLDRRRQPRSRCVTLGNMNRVILPVFSKCAHQNGSRHSDHLAPPDIGRRSLTLGDGSRDRNERTPPTPGRPRPYSPQRRQYSTRPAIHPKRKDGCARAPQSTSIDSTLSLPRAAVLYPTAHAREGRAHAGPR